MNLHPKPYLDLDPEFTSLEEAAAVVLPVPYEGGVSYGTGTAGAPEAVIKASHYLELYDEILGAEPFRMGITTLAPPDIPGDPEGMIREVCRITYDLLKRKKFIVTIGGDHSITIGGIKAFTEWFGKISVIQLDAHADLRYEYEGNPFSHACVMSRIREKTQYTLQIGIRSMSKEEAVRITDENIPVCTMHDYRSGTFDLDGILNLLPDPVFLTLDVDVFDWSVIASTGTPEPGGFLWDEGLSLLERIFTKKNIVGFDVVELSHHESDRNSPFAVAKLIYKLLGFKLSKWVSERESGWPSAPRGPLLHDDFMTDE